MPAAAAFSTMSAVLKPLEPACISVCSVQVRSQQPCWQVPAFTLDKPAAGLQRPVHLCWQEAPAHQAQPEAASGQAQTLARSCQRIYQAFRTEHALLWRSFAHQVDQRFHAAFGEGPCAGFQLLCIPSQQQARCKVRSRIHLRCGACSCMECERNVSQRTLPQVSTYMRMPSCRSGGRSLTSGLQLWSTGKKQYGVNVKGPRHTSAP